MKFTYVAIDKTSKKITGSIEAASAAAASTSLKTRGIKPLSIKVEGGGLMAKSPFSSENRKVKLKDLMIFTRQLSTMINAGVPLVRSLATLQAQTENKGFQRHIAGVTKDVESGMAFADALEKHPQVFTPIYVNMVRAGEAGGILDEILRKLAIQQEKDAHIRAKFKSAMTYPIILLSITTLVFIGLMVVVMPKLGKIIKDLGGPDATLPPLTTAMLSISHFMTSQWYVLVGGTVITVFVLKKYTSTPLGRRRKDQFLMKIPVLKEIIKKVAIARFARIFASLMSAGVNVVEAINVTSKALGNAVIEDELVAAGKAVVNGQQLSVPLANSKILPPIVSQMMAIGEETGQTDEILVKVADFYEEEVDAVVESLSSILEPIMIVIMGAMVGLIAASVIGPISKLTTQI
jgi:type IV pilus assembly protein PilC